MWCCSIAFKLFLYRIGSRWYVAANKCLYFTLTLVLHLKIYKHTAWICNTTPYTTWHTFVLLFTSSDCSRWTNQNFEFPFRLDGSWKILSEMITLFTQYICIFNIQIKCYVMTSFILKQQCEFLEKWSHTKPILWVECSEEIQVRWKCKIAIPMSASFEIDKKIV